MSARGLSPADHIAQYALLSRLVAVAVAVAVAAVGRLDRPDQAWPSLIGAIVVIVLGNYLALRNWPFVVDVIRVRDKPLYLVLDVALALTTILVVGAGSPLVLYLVGSAVLAGLVYSWRFAVGSSAAITGGYLAVLLSHSGAVPGTPDVHAVFTLPALMLGAGPAAAAVRRLLRLREQDSQAVTLLQSQMAVREERLRLSRDMHDTITKNLHGLALLAGGLRRSLDRGQVQQARDTAELVALTARQLAGSSRTVIRDLRQDGGDLAQALETAARSALAGHAVVLSWRLSQDLGPRSRGLSDATRQEVVAVVGEAVHNVVKHAQAQSVVINGDLDDDRLVLTVADDGVGLCPERAAAASRSGHVGLVGMAERVARLGGGLEVTSAPGDGTVVTVRIPLSSNAAAPAGRGTSSRRRARAWTSSVTEVGHGGGAWLSR